MTFTRVRVVGSGLIGTSLALGLRMQGMAVELLDLDPRNAELASDLMGESRSSMSGDELIVIATPPAVVLEILLSEFERNPQGTFIDISGLKSELIPQVEKFMEVSHRFCSTHPMAGREKSGPESARGDLFDGRAWILVPTAATESSIVEEVTSLVESLGSTPYVMSAADHDAAIGSISHMPQIVSSLLGASLATVSEEALLLAGQGLRDVSRLAASDPELWSELLLANRTEILPHISEMVTSLELLARSLELVDRKGVHTFIADGNFGVARIPGKHGAKPRDYTFLPIVIEDKPGELSRIFMACSEIQVNIEDLSIEHSPGQESGLITLALSESDALRLHQHLLVHGWSAHSPRK